MVASSTDVGGVRGGHVVRKAQRSERVAPERSRERSRSVRPRKEKNFGFSEFAKTASTKLQSASPPLTFFRC